VLNAKRHGVQHLAADLTGYRVHIAVITETTVLSRHLDPPPKFPVFPSGVVGRRAESQVKSNLVHFSLKITSGDNNFNNCPDNQLIKFRAFYTVKANKDQCHAAMNPCLW